MDLDAALAALRTSGLFKDTEADKLELLAFTAVPVSHAAGETLLSQGQLADHVFYVVSGRAEIALLLPDRRRLALGTVGEGHLLAAVALLAGTPSRVEVAAASDIELLSVPAEDFRRFLRQAPQATLAILEETAARADALLGSALAALAGR